VIGEQTRPQRAKMVRDAGFEPVLPPTDSQAFTALASQIASHADGIGEIATAWPELPAALKAGVLAIIRSHRVTVPRTTRPERANDRLNLPSGEESVGIGKAAAGRTQKTLRSKHSASRKKRSKPERKK